MGAVVGGGRAVAAALGTSVVDEADAFNTSSGTGRPRIDSCGRFRGRGALGASAFDVLELAETMQCLQLQADLL